MLSLKGLLKKKPAEPDSVESLETDIKRLTADHNMIQAEITKLEPQYEAALADHEDAKKRFALEDGPEPNERPFELLEIKITQLRELLTKRDQQLGSLYDKHAALMEPIARQAERDEMERRSKVMHLALEAVFDAREALTKADEAYAEAEQDLYRYKVQFPENANLADKFSMRHNWIYNGMAPLVRKGISTEQKEK